MAETIKAYRADPYSYGEARELAEQLGLSEPVAITLVRRGYRTPEQALAFLEADESHEPGEFDSMAIVVARLRAAIEAGERVTVHGDFDVDGVCATTILVGTLRELGADCDWLIPDRLADGYGLSAANVELLAERGTKLLVTVDCGVTAVEEVALAKSLGIDVDRHRPPPAGGGAAGLPDPAPGDRRLSVRRSSAGPGSPGSWRAHCERRRGGSRRSNRGEAPGDLPRPSHADPAQATSTS